MSEPQRPASRNYAARALMAAFGGWLIRDAWNAAEADWAPRTLIVILGVCLVLLAMVDTRMPRQQRIRGRAAND